MHWIVIIFWPSAPNIWSFPVSPNYPVTHFKKTVWPKVCQDVELVLTKNRLFSSITKVPSQNSCLSMQKAESHITKNKRFCKKICDLVNLYFIVEIVYMTAETFYFVYQFWLKLTDSYIQIVRGAFLPGSISLLFSWFILQLK